MMYELLKARAIEMRNKPTDAERELWYHLSGKAFENHKFRRQHVLGDYIVDFVCLKQRLIIEIDGSIHNAVEQKEKDEQRTEWLNNKGFKVVRFSNNEILSGINKVLERLHTILLAPPSGAGGGW